MRKSSSQGRANAAGKRNIVSPQELAYFQYKEISALASIAGATDDPFTRDTLTLIKGFPHKPEVWLHRVPSTRLHLLARRESSRERHHDFLPLPPKETKPGKIFVGYILAAPDDRRPIRSFFLGPENVLLGLGFFGAGGSGKTTRVFHICSQLMTLGYNCWFLDVKDEAYDLQHFHPELLVFDVPGNFEYPILRPYGDPLLWLHSLKDVTQQTMPLRPETIDTIFDECLELYREKGVLDGNISNSPSFPDLADRIEQRLQDSQTPSSEKGKLRTAVRTLRRIIKKLSPMLDCREARYSFEELIDRSVVFRLRHLSHEVQTFAANLILLPPSVLRAKDPERDRLHMVLIFDEAKILLGKDKFVRRATGVPYIKQLITQMRGLGIGLIVSDNVSTTIAPFVKPVIETFFYFRQGEAGAIREALNITGAQERHKIHFYSLRKGQAFAKRSDHPFPLLVQFPYFPKGKHISDEKLRKFVQPKPAALGGQGRQTRSVLRFPESVAFMQRSAGSAPTPSSRGVPSAELPGEWEDFLIHVVRHPGEMISDLYKSYGASHRKAHRLRKELEENGLVETRTERSGERGRPGICLKPTEKGMRFLNEQRERRNSSP